MRGGPAGNAVWEWTLAGSVRVVLKMILRGVVLWLVIFALVVAGTAAGRLIQGLLVERICG